jgi:hypothetical protein
MPDTPSHRIVVTDDEFTINEKLMSFNITSGDADSAFGARCRVQSIRIGGKILERRRYYDDLGIVCHEDIANSRIVAIYVNISDISLLKTSEIFTGELKFFSIKIKKQISPPWGLWKTKGVNFKFGLHNWVWSGVDFSCYIHGEDGVVGGEKFLFISSFVLSFPGAIPETDKVSRLGREMRDGKYGDSV